MRDQETTPTPEAVAHAMLEEITATHHSRKLPAQNGNSSRSWHWVTVFLTAALAAGALVGALGNAFFVSRSEYTTTETANSVTHEAMRQTLDRVDRTLNAQTQALTDMTKAVQAQAIEMATIKHRSDK
jgi:hypothetical protein